MLKMLKIQQFLVFQVLGGFSVLRNVENVENYGNVNDTVCPSPRDVFGFCFNIFNTFNIFNIS